MDRVRLPDLEVIRRFSIAVRTEHAPAEDVLDALRTDLERLERAMKTRRRGVAKRAPARVAGAKAARARARKRRS